MTILLALDLASSVLALVLYGWDKRAAKKHRRRISERTLHLVAVLGGWPGALLAQRVFRHKTAKRSFQAAFRRAVAVNVTATLTIVVILHLIGIAPWSRDALVPALARPTWPIVVYRIPYERRNVVTLDALQSVVEAATSKRFGQSSAIRLRHGTFAPS